MDSLIRKTMKKTVSLLVIAIIVFLTALFQFRGEIRDAYGRWERGPIPPPISRQQAQQGNVPVVTTATSEVPPKAAGSSDTNTHTPPVKPENLTPSPFAAASGNGQDQSPLPPALNLSVLFVPQAPKQVWDTMHEDTCEEAAMLMLQAYLSDTARLSLDDMEKGLTDIVAYEKVSFGPNGWQSTDAERTAAVMRDFLKFKNVKVVSITSLDDVRREIAKGFPVMLPTSGKLLYNPNFKNGGPPYHMLVAKGYTATTIITNDPGTRLGADYVYKNAVLWNAIHDWNGGNTLEGAKVMIIAE